MVSCANQSHCSHIAVPSIFLQVSATGPPQSNYVQRVLATDSAYYLSPFSMHSTTWRNWKLVLQVRCKQHKKKSHILSFSCTWKENAESSLYCLKDLFLSSLTYCLEFREKKRLLNDHWVKGQMQNANTAMALSHAFSRSMARLLCWWRSLSSAVHLDHRGSGLHQIFKW